MGCIQQYDMAARPVEALMRTPTRPQPFSKWKFELNWPAHFPGGGFLESFFFLANKVQPLKMVQLGRHFLHIG